VLCVIDRMRGCLFFASRANGLASIFFLMFSGENSSERNRPDDAEVIARRGEEHRIAPGHRDRVQDRHVAVAVDDDDVARRDRRVPHHLVRRRRAVGHEEAVIGVEDPRRVALGGGHRPE
jgi:hypothetical protein